MTNGEYTKFMKMWGDATIDSTCDKLAAEIIRKISITTVLDAHGKMVMVRAYMNGLVTNNGVVEHLKHLRNH